MADTRKLAFAAFATPETGVLIAFCEEGLKFGSATRKALAPAETQIKRAAEADKFTGKSGSTLDIVAPTGLKVARLVVIGAGKGGKLKTVLQTVALGLFIVLRFAKRSDAIHASV